MWVTNTINLTMLKICQASDVNINIMPVIKPLYIL